jgi:hypothetical protein
MIYTSHTGRARYKKGFAVPGLLGVIILLMISGGIYILNGKKTKFPAGMADQGLQIQTKVVPVDMSDWKTHQNKKHEFEVKYSPSWIVDPEWVQSSYANTELVLAQEIQDSEDFSSLSKIIIITPILIKDLADGVGESVKARIERNSNYVIAGIRAERTLAADADRSRFEHIEFVRWPFLHTIYLEWSHGAPKDQQIISDSKEASLRELDQILSTFKFTK